MNLPFAKRRADGRPACGRRRAGGAPAFACLAGLLASGLGLAAAPAADPAARPATAADCQSLLHQFDVAWAAHRDSAHATEARRSRDQGEAACTQRHYSDGVHLIRRALHDIGVKPVKIVTQPAAH